MSNTDLKIISSDTVESEGESELRPGQWWWYYANGVPGAEIEKKKEIGDLDEEDEEDDDSEEWDDDDEGEEIVEDLEEDDEEEEDDECDGPALVCIMKIGSNYVKVQTVEGESWRRGFESWYDHFLQAPDADHHITKKQEYYQDRVQHLLAEVHEITRRLGVSKQEKLSPEQTTQALVVRGEGSDYDEYKNALVKAKDETIPAIYERIKRANESLRDWLTAPTLPMSVMVTDQREIISSIKRRVFNVELYAGLSEKVIQFADGKPAEMGDKLHLMQRRCYMDEECLVAYEAGGMSFEDIDKFDEWLARPKNRDRILPFPRCMVAFRVRRRMKEFHGYTIWEFIAFHGETFNDKNTYLYIRNGEQLYRLETAIKFGKRLFPDLDHSVFSSNQLIYVRGDWKGFHFITEGEYQVRIEALSKKKAQYKIDRAAWKKKRNEWKAMSEAEREEDKEPPYFGPSPPHDNIKEYEPFTPENLYHDDIVEQIKQEAEEYNRISLIIQGLFDRSDILHPHPKVCTWTPEGFDSAIELHYDASQALTDGDPPNFDEYRAKLNSTLDVGCKTVGQKSAYREFVNEKESDRGSRYHYYGRGPGEIAIISQWKPRVRRAVFRWEEETHWEAKSNTKTRRFEIDAKDLLNLDAYTPGDFRQFYDDPRTRADYAQWAHLLLLAEEHHKGNVDEQGHVTTKANANRCKTCGKIWWRSHRCDGPKKKRKKEKKKKKQ